MGRINYAYDLLRANLVFVYGTLKKDYGNHYLLEGSEFIGEGITLANFELYDVGFPYAVPYEMGYPILGEVYKIDEEIFQRLDMLEGYPEHYKRKVIWIRLKEGEKVKAWIYYVNKPRGHEIEPKFSEDFRTEILKWG